MRDFVLWVDDSLAPPNTGGSQKFNRIINHAASDYKMSRFKKRKHKMRKVRGKKDNGTHITVCRFGR